jgi:iron complex outermembrane recepter protein
MLKIKAKKASLTATSSVLAMLLSSTTALTQTAPVTDEAITLEEIIVTAQRRKQKIEEVPISITAFTSADLQKKNITGIEDYFSKTANVSLSEGVFGRQSTNIGIRGVSNIGGVNDAFTIYIDEFAGLAVNPGIYDAERVEVLRGPQGTYFGRNSTGGAINITTIKPKDSLGAGGEVGYASFKTFTAKGFVNIPLSSKAFVRLTGDTESSAGFVKNLSSTGSQPSIRNYTLRGQLRLVPTERITIDLQGILERDKIGLLQSVPTGVLDDNAGIANALISFANLRSAGIPDFGIPGNPTIAPLSPGFNNLPFDPATGAPIAVNPGNGFFPQNTNQVNTGSPEINANNREAFIGKLAFDFDFATFTSITGYQVQRRETRRDTDGIEIDLARDFQTGRDRIFTQEIRLNSAPSEIFNWTLGAYFLDLKTRSNQVISVGPEIAAALGTSTFLEATGSTNTESYAAFAEVSYSPIERLTATLGLRYTRDTVGVGGITRSLEGLPDFNNPDQDAALASVFNFIDNGVTLGAPIPITSVPVSFTDVSPRLALTYQFDNGVNAYATVSNGYKSGGNQTSPQAVAAGIESFRPEDIWNYEVGLKGRAFDNTLQFGLAAFYANWKNLQVSTEVLGVGQAFNIIGNAASARNYGFEADFTWLTPLKGLLLNGSVGYLNAKFKNFPNAQLSNFNDVCRATVGQPGPAGGGAPDCDLSGQRLPQASKWTVSLGGDYTTAITDGIDGFIGADMSYRSSFTPSLNALALGGANGVFPYAIRGYTVVNVRTGIDAGKWRIDGYVQNVFNKQYFTNAFGGGSLDGYRVVPSPRVFGVRAGFEF